MELKGSLESDGSTYDVYQHQQVDVPSVDGPNTSFPQLWSIRRDPRTNGTINTGNHYKYWQSIGLPVNTFGYQILSSEGISGSGTSSVTVTEGDGTETASSPLSPSPTPSDAPSPQIAPPSPIAFPHLIAPSSSPTSASSLATAVSASLAALSSITTTTPASTCRSRYRKRGWSLQIGR